MRYNFTGEFLSDGKVAGKALMLLAVSDDYNMDTVNAEIAIFEYLYMHHQDAVMLDSIVEAARRWLDKTHNTDFAKQCIVNNRKMLDNADNRKIYSNICRCLHSLLLRTTYAIVAQKSKPSHIKPSEILPDEQISIIVDTHPSYLYKRS